MTACRMPDDAAARGRVFLFQAFPLITSCVTSVDRIASRSLSFFLLDQRRVFGDPSIFGSVFPCSVFGHGYIPRRDRVDLLLPSDRERTVPIDPFFSPSLPCCVVPICFVLSSK